jgi:hypothetical protein
MTTMPEDRITGLPVTRPGTNPEYELAVSRLIEAEAEIDALRAVLATGTYDLTNDEMDAGIRLRAAATRFGEEAAPAPDEITHLRALIADQREQLARAQEEKDALGRIIIDMGGIVSHYDGEPLIEALRRYNPDTDLDAFIEAFGAGEELGDPLQATRITPEAVANESVTDLDRNNPGSG